MVTPHSAGAPEAPKPWYYLSLTKQIMLGLVIGVVVGALLAQLPPEARKLLEEARRRRAIRWPSMPVEASPPAARP